MKIELWDLDRIRPYHQNPRNNDPAVDAVAASLREFGWRQPIVTDSEGVIIVGDTRLKAARKLSLKQAPVHVATDLSPAQIRAYRIADNQTGNISDWNPELLAIELNDLEGMDFDLNLLGFEPDELAQWMGEEAKVGFTDPDSVPPPPDEVVTQLGDLWILGGHRLLCGDSTKAADVQKVLGAQIPFLMVTDPPYGVEYDPTWRHEAGVNKSNRKGKVKNDNIADWTPAWRLFPGNVAYVWHGGLHSATVQQSLLGSDFVVRAQIVWVKPRTVLSRGHYHWKHEPCLYGWKEGAGHLWASDRKQTTILEFDRPSRSGEHPTMKPVALVERAIRNSSKSRDIVLDLFGGSGSTLIACEKTARDCRMMELDPKYCQVIVDRMLKLDPTLQIKRNGQAYIKQRQNSDAETREHRAI